MKKSLSRILFLSILLSSITPSTSNAQSWTDWLKSPWNLPAGVFCAASLGLSYLWAKSTNIENRAKEQEQILNLALHAMEMKQRIQINHVTNVLEELHYSYVSEFKDLAQRYNNNPENNLMLRNQIEKHIFGACGYDKPQYRCYPAGQHKKPQRACFSLFEEPETLQSPEGSKDPGLKTKAGIPIYQLINPTLDVLSSKAENKTMGYLFGTILSSAIFFHCLGMLR